MGVFSHQSTVSQSVSQLSIRLAALDYDNVGGVDLEI